MTIEANLNTLQRLGVGDPVVGWARIYGKRHGMDWKGNGPRVRAPPHAGWETSMQICRHQLDRVNCADSVFIIFESDDSGQ